MAHPKGIDPAAMAKIAEFAKLFWANRGNHNDLTSQKFLPAFTFEQLEKAALVAQQNGFSDGVRRSPAAQKTIGCNAGTGVIAGFAI